MFLFKTTSLTLEIYRRFCWNFFRLENEHLNNCGDFRAVRDISIAPVKDDDIVKLERMMDKKHGVKNRKPLKQNGQDLKSRLVIPESKWAWQEKKESKEREFREKQIENLNRNRDRERKKSKASLKGIDKWMFAREKLIDGRKRASIDSTLHFADTVDQVQVVLKSRSEGELLKRDHKRSDEEE